MVKRNILTLILILGIAFIFNFLSIRICPFFNLFKIPCPGCGLTRSVKLIFQGKILESLNYNPVAIIILILLIIYFTILIIGKKKEFDKFTQKHQKLIITFAIITTTIIWIININNPLLY